jgi:small GTP-binding protein
MPAKAKVHAEANAAHASANAARDSLSAAHESMNAAAYGAAAAAMDAAEQLKNTVKDHLPGKAAKEVPKNKIMDTVEQIKNTVKDHLPGKADKEETHPPKNKMKDTVEHIKNTVKDHLPGKAAKEEKHSPKNKMMDIVEQLKNTVMGYFPAGKAAKEIHHAKHHHLFHKDQMPEKSHMISFFAMPYMAIMIALIVVLFSALLFMKRRQIMKLKPMQRFRDLMMTKQKGNSTVLICGPVDAGKTLLFHTLSGGKFQPTQTSMEENVNTFTINDKILTDAKKDKLKSMKFEFIDFPGKQSHEFKMDKFMNRLDGVIILVDSSSSDSINHGAKTLFSLMEKKIGNIPVLFCANKIDLSESHTMNVTRHRILDELNKLKDTQSSMGNIEKSEDITTASIGKSGEKLSWDNLGLAVSFGQISAKQGNITDVLDFLEGIQH